MRASELQGALERTLAEVDADPRSGPVLRAAGVRLRLELTDMPLVLNLATSDDPAHHLRWSFSDQVDWEPGLELWMSSETANAYLQGRLNLPIAIARGTVTVKGGSRAVLLYLPVAKLLVEPFRRAVRAGFPTLALD
jgi:hypothetical protein